MADQAYKGFMMKGNVGNTDRTLRILAGFVLIGLTLTHTIGIWGWLGVILVLTGFFRFCPAYSIFGLNSGKTK